MTHPSCRNASGGPHEDLFDAFPRRLPSRMGCRRGTLRKHRGRRRSWKLVWTRTRRLVVRLESSPDSWVGRSGTLLWRVRVSCQDWWRYVLVRGGIALLTTRRSQSRRGMGQAVSRRSREWRLGRIGSHPSGVLMAG